MRSEISYVMTRYIHALFMGGKRSTNKYGFTLTYRRKRTKKRRALKQVSPDTASVAFLPADFTSPQFHRVSCENLSDLLWIKTVPPHTSTHLVLITWTCGIAFRRWYHMCRIFDSITTHAYFEVCNGKVRKSLTIGRALGDCHSTVLDSAINQEFPWTNTEIAALVTEGLCLLFI